MPITATFSNGFTDTYKGYRNVRAAWMITDRETGEVICSGHSLDADRAHKTAEGYARKCAIRSPDVPLAKDFYRDPETGELVQEGSGGDIRPIFEEARKLGFEGRVGQWGALERFIKAHNNKRRDAVRALNVIEVIEL